jgi:hypothetical protein
MLAPAIGAGIYSHASVTLPDAIVGPNARAEVKTTPVRAEPFMMWTVT